MLVTSISNKIGVNNRINMQSQSKSADKTNESAGSVGMRYLYASNINFKATNFNTFLYPNDINPQQKLILACRSGDKRTVQNILKLHGLSVGSALSAAKNNEIKAMLQDYKVKEFMVNNKPSEAVELSENKKRINNKFLNAIKDGNLTKVCQALAEGADVNAKDSDGDPAIMLAINDEFIFDELLKRKDLDVNTYDSQGDNPLLLLCTYSGNADIIEKLLNHENINVNVQDSQGITPLMALMSLSPQDGLKYMNMFLSRDDLNINQQDGKGATALMRACSNKENVPYVYEILKRKDVDFTLKTASDYTAYDFARTSIQDINLVATIKKRMDEQLENSEKIQKDYYKNRSSINNTLNVDTTKLSPEDNIWTKEQITKKFDNLISNKNVRTAQNMLKVTPYIDFEENERTLLKKVCTLGDPDFVMAVFDYQKNQKEMTEEYEAKREAFLDNLQNMTFAELKKSNFVMNSIDGFKILISSPDFKPNEITSTGDSMFEVACKLDSKGALTKEILSSFDDVNTGKALGFASTKIKGLINEYETNGKYELKLANMKRSLSSYETAEEGVKKLKDFISSNNFNPQLSDVMGNNMLHIISGAPSDGSRGIIQTLINKGLDINSKNVAGQTPLMTAIKQLIIPRSEDEKTRILSNIKFIIDKGANIDEQDANGQTAFHYACMTSSIALLNLILSKRPNVFLQDVNGNPPSKYLKNEAAKKVFMDYISKLI